MNGFMIVIGLSLALVLSLLSIMLLGRLRSVRPAKTKQRRIHQSYPYSAPNPKSNKAKRRAKAQHNKRNKGYSSQIQPDQAQHSLNNSASNDQSTAASYASSSNDSAWSASYDYSQSTYDSSSSGDSAGSWSSDSSSSSDSNSGDSSGSW